MSQDVRIEYLVNLSCLAVAVTRCHYLTCYRSELLLFERGCAFSAHLIGNQPILSMALKSISHLAQATFWFCRPSVVSKQCAGIDVAQQYRRGNFLQTHNHKLPLSLAGTDGRA